LAHEQNEDQGSCRSEIQGQGLRKPNSPEFHSGEKKKGTQNKKGDNLKIKFLKPDIYLGHADCRQEQMKDDFSPENHEHEKEHRTPGCPKKLIGVKIDH
jgi:hypothetical protein